MNTLRLARGEAGFTLIELVVTLAIIAVLGLMTVPVAQITLQRSKEQDLRLALREIRQALDAHKRAVDEGQIQPPDGGSGYPSSLQALVDGVPRSADPKDGKVYFLRRVPRDPMADAPELSAEATWGLRSFDSEASDPRAGVDIYDVHSRSDRVGLNGVAYRWW